MTAAALAAATVLAASPAQAYQPTPATAYTAQNPSSCNKSPCILYPKSAQLPSGRLVMAFEDSEGPVAEGRRGMQLAIARSQGMALTHHGVDRLGPRVEERHLAADAFG